MRVLCCGMLAAVLLLGSVHAQEVTASRDADAIIALELKLTDLLERSALDEYTNHLTPDYAPTTPDGHLITRDEALASWRSHGPGYKMIPSDMRVRVKGDTAILTARVLGPDGGPGTRITKTFVRINGSWLLAALHSSQIAEPRQR